jgi:hypothetical protein
LEAVSGFGVAEKQEVVAMVDAVSLKVLSNHFNQFLSDLCTYYNRFAFGCQGVLETFFCFLLYSCGVPATLGFKPSPLDIYNYNRCDTKLQDGKMYKIERGVLCNVLYAPDGQFRDLTL